MHASSILPRLRLVAAVSFVSLSSLAAAQTGTPVTPSTCVSPGDIPSPRPGMNTAENFQKKVDAYGVCLKAYVAEQRAAADASITLARAHQDAANEAINAYNDYVTKLNAQQEKANK